MRARDFQRRQLLDQNRKGDDMTDSELGIVCFVEPEVRTYAVRDSRGRKLATVIEYENASGADRFSAHVACPHAYPGAIRTCDGDSFLHVAGAAMRDTVRGVRAALQGVEEWKAERGPTEPPPIAEGPTAARGDAPTEPPVSAWVTEGSAGEVEP